MKIARATGDTEDAAVVGGNRRAKAAEQGWEAGSQTMKG